jgi:hypothetical protein
MNESSVDISESDSVGLDVSGDFPGWFLKFKWRMRKEGRKEGTVTYVSEVKSEE